jgi:alkylation response protein AidB-like acyl-CoA dehydrogenase
VDFGLDDSLTAAKTLAASVFSEMADTDRVKRVENHDGGHDAKLWSTLAETGLIGLAVPEASGGAGLGMLGLITILEQQGRRVAPVPLWPVVAGAALPIAQFGTPEQRARWLPPILGGAAIVTAAPDAAIIATADGEGRWRLDGVLPCVPAAPVADAIVAPVRFGDDRTGTAVIPSDRAGVDVAAVAATDRQGAATVGLTAVPQLAADLLRGTDVAAWMLRRCQVALAGLQAGVCGEALHMTAAYASQRVQFGRPLSTNQAVAVRAADAYLDTEAVRLTAQRAAWLMDTGRDDIAEPAALVAKWWASRAGLRVVHATQHLHGGIAADIDYPMHRYYLWGRQIAFSLGSAAAVAAELGARLPSAPPIGAPR